MTELSPMEDKFTVYIRKSCECGPYLDPSKVARLPDFFQENSTAQTITKVIEAVILSGANFKETFDKVPAYLGPGLKGVDFEITEHDKDGQRKKHHYKLPVVDRKSKGESILDKLVQNLMCCSKFLSYSQSICKECCAKQGKFTPLKIEPTDELSKKEPTTCSPKMPKSKPQFTVYCRRNCKVGPLLDPVKIKKLPTSFSGSLPKIIQSLVPAIVLSGHNPNDAIKRVPSSQGRCILVNVKIGKLNQMCLVRSLDSSVRFWSFLKKFCSAFGMCEKFFSEKSPRKSACKECRNLVAKADDYNSDDDFQNLKGYKEWTDKRKRKIKDEPTSVKKSKPTKDSSQFKCKELKVVIECLPRDKVKNYLKRDNLPRTPTRKQVKQVYLHSNKIDVVVPQIEKSPEKSLFPEAPSLLLSPVEGKDDEADNLFNFRATQENTQPEHAEMSTEEISIEKADIDNYLLDTFFDQGVEDNYKEVMEEMSEKIEEGRNPLQGLFEKSDEQQDSSSSREARLEDAESFEQYSSSFDAVQLFSPGSIFGDALGSTEVSSCSERIEMGGKKGEQEKNEKSPSKDVELEDMTSVDMEETSATMKIQTESDSFDKVDPEDFKIVKVKEEKMSSESEAAVDNSLITSVEVTPVTSTTPEFQSPRSEDFSLTAVTSTICPAPLTQSPLHRVSGSGKPSIQVPQQSLPGNVPNSGFPVVPNVTCGMPMVSLPGNSGSNPTSTIKHDIDSISLSSVSLTGNQGTMNTSSTSISSGALPGPNTNTSSSRSMYTTNRQQFPPVECDPFSNRPKSTVEKVVYRAAQKAAIEVLRHSRQQVQPFVSPNMNVSLGGPYSYQGTTNNLMANRLPQAGSQSLYSVQSPRYYPSNQTSQALPQDKRLQVPAARYNLPLMSLQTFGPAFVKAALPIRQPHSSTNQTPRQVTNQSIPYTTALSEGLSATRYCSSSAMGQIVCQSVPKTNPSTVMTRNHPPSTCFQQNSYSVPNISPSVASMTQYYTPLTTFQLPSYSIPSNSPSTAVAQSTSWHLPGLASRNPVNQSSSAVASTTSYYPSSAIRHPVSQSFVGTNSSLAVAPTTSCYPSSAIRHPVSQSFVGTNSSSAVAPTTSYYPSSAIRHPVSQSFVGNNQFSSEVQAVIGQPSQFLPLISESHDTGKIQASLTETISKSSSIPTGSAEGESNVDEGEITPESSNNDYDRSNNHDNEPVVKTPPETQKPLKINLLVKTMFVLLKKCAIVLSKEQGLHLRKKLEQMLRNRRHRLAVTQKDINDLEEIVGAEIRKDVAFQNLIKLITAEYEENDVYHSMSNPENQPKQSNATVTGQVTAMTQSVNSAVRNSTVTLSPSSSHMDLTPSVEPDSDNASDNRTESSTSNNDETILEQPSEESSIPTSRSSMVNNQPKNVPSNSKSNPSLPKPFLQVSKIQGTTILLWDLPDQSANELIKMYELYAIQLEANQNLTKDLIRSMMWKKIGKVKALPPPMAITFTNLLGGFKNYMIVRGVDENGCFGPFSSLCEVSGLDI